MSSDFKWPFSWNDRRAVLEKGVFFVPDFYKNHNSADFPGFDSVLVFGNKNPVFIEYCSGNGAWLLDRAIQNPEQNFVAVEIKFDRAKKIFSKAQKAQIKNLFVVLGEGMTFTKNYVKAGEIAGSFVNFPDPWPKERHAKHRIIQSPFVEEVARVTVQGGSLTLVTDDAPYSKQMIEVVLESKNWNSVLHAPYYTHLTEAYGNSYFRTLWEEKGRFIFYHQFILNRAIANE